MLVSVLVTFLVVILVLYLFLRRVTATIIPALAVLGPGANPRATQVVRHIAGRREHRLVRKAQSRRVDQDSGRIAS